MTLIFTMNSWDILAIHDTTKTIIMALVQSLFIIFIADASVAQAFLSAIAAIFAIVVFYQVRAEGYLDHYGISQQQNLKQGGSEQTNIETRHKPDDKSPPISKSPENINWNLKKPDISSEPEIGIPENLDDFLEEIEEPTISSPNTLNQSTHKGLTQNAIKSAPTSPPPLQQEPEPTTGKNPPSSTFTTKTPSLRDESIHTVAAEGTSTPGTNPNSDRNPSTQGGNGIPAIDNPGYTEASSVGIDSGIQEADDL